MSAQEKDRDQAADAASQRRQSAVASPSCELLQVVISVALLSARGGITHPEQRAVDEEVTQ
eukprot:876684-Prorocentrum_minimum.AAC.1